MANGDLDIFLNSDQPELSIVMPCLNEEKSIKICISKAIKFIYSNKIKAEIVIGDNGSKDNSIAIAEQMGARVVRIRHRGYGAALSGAIDAAKGKYIVMGDSDDSYDFSSVGDFLTQLRNGADIVIGNRFRGGIMPNAMPWKNRFIGNPVLTRIGRVLFDIDCGDFHCGLRGMTKKSFKHLNLKSKGMEFASEMLIRASLRGLDIVEVPTKLYKDARDRKPHLRPWRDGFRHLILMLTFSPKWTFLYPGLLALVTGLIAGIAIYTGPVFISNVGFDIGTMLLAATLVSVGLQAVIFFAITTFIGTTLGLLPENRLNTYIVTKPISFEVAMISGLVMVTIGVVIILTAIIGWIKLSFGTLNPHELLRILIPACLAITSGSQLILGILYIKFLGVTSIDS